MSADNKTGLALGKASKIGDVITTAGHDAVGEMTNTGDALKEPDVGSVNIEEVAQLAKLCAAGTPSDKDFKAIKERVSVAGNEAVDENDRAHLVPKDWRQPRRLRQVNYLAIRTPETMHSSSRSKWPGTSLTFLPG